MNTHPVWVAAFQAKLTPLLTDGPRFHHWSKRDWDDIFKFADKAYDEWSRYVSTAQGAVVDEPVVDEPVVDGPKKADKTKKYWYAGLTYWWNGVQWEAKQPVGPNVYFGKREMDSVVEQGKARETTTVEEITKKTRPIDETTAQREA